MDAGSLVPDEKRTNSAEWERVIRKAQAAAAVEPQRQRRLTDELELMRQITSQWIHPMKPIPAIPTRNILGTPSEIRSTQLKSITDRWTAARCGPVRQTTACAHTDSTALGRGAAAASCRGIAWWLQRI